MRFAEGDLPVVGIVIVAHSMKLAEAVVELASQMLKKQVPMAAAGGVEDPEHPFGTDAMRILRAIESVYSDDGVVVLMDMGSALLSADTALELLPEEKRNHVRLCEAPLVEGAVSAAVSSEADADLEQVLQEARGAQTFKVEQVCQVQPSSPVEEQNNTFPHKPASSRAQASYRPEVLSQPQTTRQEMSSPGKTRAPTNAGNGPGPEALSGAELVPQLLPETKEVKLKILNPLGVHARPAALLVSTAARYRSEILIRNVTRNTMYVNARSINRVSTLGIRMGHEIALTASGDDAEQALAELKAVVESGFGESEEDAVRMKKRQGQPGHGETRASAGGELAGIPASPGIALGPAVLYKIAAAGIPLRRISDPQAEWLRFQRAVGRVVKQTREMKVRILEKSGEYEASIFDAHLLSIEDPALCEAVRKGVYGEKISAEYVWSRAVDQMISDYEAVEDRYIRSRASDLADIKTWVLRALLGKSMEVFRLKVPGVIVARDLSPSEIARLNIGRVRGICTAYGNANSHAAILARALNIPAVVGVGIDLLRIAPGSVLVVRGDEGRITVNPKDLQVYKRKRSQWLLSLKKETQSVKKKAITIDGRRVRMAANIGGPFEVRSAVERGAEEIGILRTEFLFLERTTAPSEEEQVAVYRDIARRLGKRTLIIRTLDAGGDKPLPYIVQRKEQNPYLGVRGIRLSLNNPELFKAQLRAILRASAGNTMKIMLPMVSSVDEVRLTREMLEALKKDCRTEGVLFDENLDLGIMVEVPSAVIVAERLASEVSFFSIGTNDLCQYVMAADRSNERLATLYDALHPAVLRLVRQTVEAGHAAGIWVSVCGEIAGDRTAAPVLVGLGVDELSMQPQAIPSIKRIISSLTLTGAKKIAQEVLGFDSAVQVRQYIESRAFL